MNQSKTGTEARGSALREAGIILFCLLLLLGFLFRDGIMPGRTVFSNDGPLGAMSAKCGNLPEGFYGFWNELNWLGAAGPSASPDVSNVLSLFTGKLIFSKIYAPFALLFLGFGAWLCFRQWKFSPAACILGGIAAALVIGNCFWAPRVLSAARGIAEPKRATTATGSTGDSHQSTLVSRRSRRR